MDKLLLILFLLLIGTLGAFLTGLIPYPFGVMALSALVVVRLFVLAVRKVRKG